MVTSFAPSRFLAGPVYSPPVVQAPQQPTVTRILHTHDTHENYGVMPNVVTAMAMATQDGLSRGMDVIKTSGGDYNYGDNPGEWPLNVQIYNRIGLDVATNGNHELDAGVYKAAQGMAQAHYPTVVVNYNLPDTHPFQHLRQTGQLSLNSIVIKKPHDLYGVIGITPPELKDHLKPTTPLEGLTVADIQHTTQRVQEEVNRLRAEGIHKVILVSHGGVDLDREIAQQTSGVDVIVGGHTHTKLDGVQPGVNWLQSATGEPVLIMQTGKNGKAVGMTDIMWDTAGRPWPLQYKLLDPQAFPKDPVTQQMIDQVEGPRLPLAVLDKDYNEKDLTQGESAMGNFAADATREATGADVGLCHSGSLRSDLHAGLFTNQDLKFLSPYSSKLVKMAFTGEELLSALSHSAENLALHSEENEVLHVSGLRYQINSHSGGLEGVAVQNRQTGQWEPIDPLKVYTVGYDEYGAKRSKDYDMLRQPDRILQTFPVTMAHALARRLQEQEQQNHSPVVHFPLEGRIAQAD